MYLTLIHQCYLVGTLSLNSGLNKVVMQKTVLVSLQPLSRLQISKYEALAFAGLFCYHGNVFRAGCDSRPAVTLI